MLIWLPWAFSLSTASPCCHRKCSQASNRKFITVKLTSVISIFTHCAKCFYVYVKPFLELIFNVYVHFHCFPPSSQIIKLPPPLSFLEGGESKRTQCQSTRGRHTPEDCQRSRIVEFTVRTAALNGWERREHFLMRWGHNHRFVFLLPGVWKTGDKAKSWKFHLRSREEFKNPPSVTRSD